MKALSLAALAAAATLFCAANAAEPLTAKLQAALSAPQQAVAGGAVFDCKGDTCATSDASADSSLAGCRELARAVGAVASFGKLGADKLAKCNQSARTAATVAKQ